jgi:hypothetical protein
LLELTFLSYFVAIPTYCSEGNLYSI